MEMLMAYLAKHGMKTTTDHFCPAKPSVQQERGGEECWVHPPTTCSTDLSLTYRATTTHDDSCTSLGFPNI